MSCVRQKGQLLRTRARVRRGWSRLTLLLLVALACGLSADGEAAKFRRPFGATIGVNYGYDHNGSASGCVDYGCGSRCYNGHGGTDFPLSVGTKVRAAAAGTVTARHDGCPTWGFLGSSCGGGAGNYVQVDHNDGTVTLYGHLRNGSVQVSNGQHVNCGQMVGRSGSSGSSTGAHLHFDFRHWGTRKDPFSGSCSQATSWWVHQGPYSAAMPSTECDCACNPGQTQNQNCGNCGTRSRTCKANCQWGTWSTCSGQGVCNPGNVRTQDCCDCGTRTRSCKQNCTWTVWSACDGPDPNNGNTVCDGAGCGPCAEGRIRCVDGCRQCVPNHTPVEEICDGLDNDCSCAVDDGYPETMGSPPPAFAARLVDFSYPAVMTAGEVAAGWAIFENAGTEAWPAWDVWLSAHPSAGATAAAPGGALGFHDPLTWPAWDVLAVVDRDVPPGDSVLLELSFRAPEAPGDASGLFQLLTPDGTTMQCPTPTLALDVQVVEVVPGTGGDGAGQIPGGSADGAAKWTAGCSCHAAPAGGVFPHLVLLLVSGLWIVLIRRRRWQGRGGRVQRRGWGG